MRSRQTSATARESLHVPVPVPAAAAAAAAAEAAAEAAAAAMGTTSTRALTERVVGVTAIALGASILIQNVMVGWADAPGYGDPIREVLAWHQQNRVVVAIAVGQEAPHLPLLLGFLSGLHGIVARRGGAGAVWSRLALAAGATLSAVWALYAVLWIGAALSADDLAEPSPVFELAWQLHGAALALALSALGITSVGAAMAAYAVGLTPPWQRLLGVAGAGLLLASGAVSLAIADGSALVLVGAVGLFAWPVWLLATGVRLMRRRTVARYNDASMSDRDE